VCFPINKKLWTSSFVLLTAGLALVCLSLCYWLVDIKLWRRWTKPILVFGANSIAAYVLSELLASLLYHLASRVADGSTEPWQEIIYENVFTPNLSPANASLFYALTYVAVCWVVMWVLYRKKIFLKI
jgi:predicted acyltransferase